MAHADSFDSLPSVETTRRAYQAPRLRDYGHVREITRTNFTQNYSGEDGGSVPYVYVS